ncbi:hypothetical protein Bhyg_08329 [Pseudolycoriella hygida]|uniref:Uncharacterized protein n=1 Tax=Pseudolycoriella hygida TaxID=35572 RepID=A0A9Q0N4G7_9DIPT|nr:hypothetical protein Bhyg_08329 [Pseudolycoriella hygida]
MKMVLNEFEKYVQKGNFHVFVREKREDRKSLSSCNLSIHKSSFRDNSPLLSRVINSIGRLNSTSSNSLAPLNCNLTPITHHRSESVRCVKIIPNVDSSGKRKNINLNNELFIGDNNTTPKSPKNLKYSYAHENTLFSLRHGFHFYCGADDTIRFISTLPRLLDSTGFRFCLFVNYCQLSQASMSESNKGEGEKGEVNPNVAEHTFSSSVFDSKLQNCILCDECDNSEMNSSPSAKSQGNKSSHSQSVKQCPICLLDSCKKVQECSKLLSLAPIDRWSEIKAKRLCYSCFGKHRSFKCRSRQKCQVDGSQSNHHVLLHDKSRQHSTNQQISSSPVVTSTKNQSSKSDSTSGAVVANCNSLRTREVPAFFKIVPVVLYGRKKAILTYAYMDDGSDLTLIERELASQLNLEGTPDVLNVRWAFKNSEEETDSETVAVRISGDFKASRIRPVAKLAVLDVKKNLKYSYAHENTLFSLRHGFHFYCGADDTIRFISTLPRLLDSTKAYDSQNKFRKILAEYTDLTNPNAIHGSTKVNVYHHIETKGAVARGESDRQPPLTQKQFSNLYFNKRQKPEKVCDSRISFGRSLLSAEKACESKTNCISSCFMRSSKKVASFRTAVTMEAIGFFNELTMRIILKAKSIQIFP